MRKRVLLCAFLGVGLGQLQSQSQPDQAHVDRLLNLHRSILIANTPKANPFGAMNSAPVPLLNAQGPDTTIPAKGLVPSLTPPDKTALPDQPTATTLPKTASRFPSILDHNMIVAFYGSPFSPKMGILGEQPMEETARLVKLKAAEWDAINGEQHCIAAFHLIYATVWADANVGVLSDKVVQQYIDYAAKNDMLVILDHQLGKLNPADCVRSMLRWLKYPNVHLAIDPEWKTLTPGKEIGSINASDINACEELIQEYLVKEGIEQKKLFIVHQFNWKMIIDREKVRSDFDRIDLIHNADGYGNPSLKLGTYAYVALAKNMPIKGFKLFFPKPWKTDGYDKPMMQPSEILALKPRPVYINYQ